MKRGSSVYEQDHVGFFSSVSTRAMSRLLDYCVSLCLPATTHRLGAFTPNVVQSLESGALPREACHVSASFNLLSHSRRGQPARQAPGHLSAIHVICLPRCWCSRGRTIARTWRWCGRCSAKCASRTAPTAAAWSWCSAPATSWCAPFSVTQILQCNKPRRVLPTVTCLFQSST